MLKFAVVVLLCAVSSLSRPEGLDKGPEPGEGELQDDKKHSKRQFFLSPIPQQPYPFIPIYIPYQQVVQVHHVVMMQPPNCIPQPGYPQQPLPPNGYLPPPGQPAMPGTTPTQRPTPQQPPFEPQPPPFQPPMTDDGGLDDRTGMNATMPRKPSRCVWAIVACCSPDSTNIRYSCFELLGCPGAFWGVNPCEPRVVQAAANTALKFYMSGGQEDDSLSSNSL